MAAKGKTAQPKASRKPSNPTPVSEVIKAKKIPAKKPAKKAVRKPAAPKITEPMLRNALLKMTSSQFIAFTQDWNEENLNVKIKNYKDYDEALNYFKTLPPNTIKLLARTGMDILSTEAYAALARWHDIISNPGRIDKIHQSGLTRPRNKKQKSIAELAALNDRLGVLQATRDKIAEKLEKGAGARDTAALARELTEVMTQISDYQKRLGPKKDTKLRQLLDSADVLKKRPSSNGGGSRNTSFKSRVTIEDLEND